MQSNKTEGLSVGLLEEQMKRLVGSEDEMEMSK